MTATDDAPAAAVHFDHHATDFAADPWPTLAELAGLPGRPQRRLRRLLGGHRLRGDRAGRPRRRHVLVGRDDPDPAQEERRPEVDPDRDGRARVPRVPQDHAAAVRSAGASSGSAPVIEYYANHCIDEFIEHGEVDIVHDFADPAGDGHPAQARAADRRLAPLRRADAQDGVPAPGQPGPRRRAGGVGVDRRHDQGGDPAAQGRRRATT